MQTRLLLVNGRLLSTNAPIALTCNWRCFTVEKNCPQRPRDVRNYPVPTIRPEASKGIQRVVQTPTTDESISRHTARPANIPGADSLQEASIELPYGYVT